MQYRAGRRQLTTIAAIAMIGENSTHSTAAIGIE